MKKITTLLNKLSMVVERKTLLWTNPSPASTFESQTISLSLDDYDEVEILYKWTTSSSETKSVRSAIGGSARAEGLVVVGVSNLQFASRDFGITPTGVNVGVGNYSYTNYTQWFKYSGGDGNTLIIPYKIFGIKLGG